MVRATAEQQSVEQLLPAIAQWVRGYGPIEIDDQELFGFVARALDGGGLAFEDDKPATLRQGTGGSGRGPAEWFEGQGIEVQCFRE